MEPHRVLDPEPVPSLAAYEDLGGGEGLDAARRLGAAAVVDEVEASGLRGRGGAGFPTGVKWRTVAERETRPVPTTVVVNAAEGEPGTFKDRAILRTNPYRVIEGALVAALAVGGADRIVLALKRSFETEAHRLRDAIREVEGAGWTEEVVKLSVFEGPTEYLFGEETGLLEALDGREPFPRVAPPYRHGVDEIGDVDDGVRSPATTVMSTEGTVTEAPPTLVNNVETLANVPAIVARGADWFRSVGTDESPGTVVCTVSGWTARDGVGEVPLGTPMREVIEAVGGGVGPERRVLGVLSGVAHPMLPGTALDAPVSYEGLDAAGAGLGAAGFIVFDDTVHPLAVAEGVARFLAVESCGQCTPCKADGLAISERLASLREREARDDEHGDVLEAVRERLATVAESARCYLAHQHQQVVQSILALFPDEIGGRPRGETVEPLLIAPLVDIRDGRAVLDESQARKQPDWSHGERWDGRWPTEARDERAGQPTEEPGEPGESGES